jgi:DNA-binding NarL/FixJ family response regulator
VSIRVIIADDQALVRAGFHRLLDGEPDIEVTGEAGDGVEAVDLALRTRADVVLMDIRMPGVDGLEATRRILRASATTKVLIVTTFDLDEYVFDALKAGASGFLLKDSPPDDLISGIHVVAAGDALLAPSITKRLISEFASRPTGASGPALRANELTAREREVLELLARGLSNREIAAEITIGAATVKTHVANVLLKLDLRDRAQAIVFAYESGIVRPGG